MRLLCVDSAAPIIGPCGECVAAPLDGGTHFRREADQIPNVVQRQQPETQQLPRDEQMAQVAARIRRARLAVTARVQWPVVGAVGGVPNVQRAFRCKRRAVAPAARWCDAVEQIDAALDRGDEIRGKPTPIR